MIFVENPIHFRIHARVDEPNSENPSVYFEDTDQLIEYVPFGGPEKEVPLEIVAASRSGTKTQIAANWWRLRDEGRAGAVRLARLSFRGAGFTQLFIAAANDPNAAKPTKLDLAAVSAITDEARIELAFAFESERTEGAGEATLLVDLDYGRPLQYRAR